MRGQGGNHSGRAKVTASPAATAKRAANRRTDFRFISRPPLLIEVLGASASTPGHGAAEPFGGRRRMGVGFQGPVHGRTPMGSGLVNALPRELLKGISPLSSGSSGGVPG